MNNIKKATSNVFNILGLTPEIVDIAFSIEGNTEFSREEILILIQDSFNRMVAKYLNTV